MAWDIEPVFDTVVDASFPDVDSMCDAVRSWNLDFRPLVANEAMGAAGRLRQARSGPLELGYARIRAALEQFGAPPPGAYTFVIPGKAFKRLWWRGHETGPATILVFPIGSELYSLSGPDFEISTVTISEALVDEICEDLGLVVPVSRFKTEVFDVEPAVLGELRLHLSVLSQDVPSDFPLDSQWVAELLVSTWLGQPNPRRLQTSANQRRDLAMRKCLSIIEKSDFLELTPTTLCESAGVSERTLQYAFRDRFGITPAAFLKARRLAAVRRALLNPLVKDPAVGDIAGDFGFWHVGQFAADYRRVFGELPSATVMRRDS